MFETKFSGFLCILIISAAIAVIDAGIVYHQSALLGNDLAGNESHGSSYSCMYNNGVITVNGVSRNATDEEKTEMEQYMEKHGEQMSHQMMSSMHRMWDHMKRMFSSGFFVDENKTQERENAGENVNQMSEKNHTDVSNWEWPLSSFSSDMPQAPSFCREAEKERKAKKEEEEKKKTAEVI